MAINKKPHFRGNDYNNQELKDAKSLQLNQDAVASDEAVRKSQAESISDQAAQDILVESAGSASNSTAFTSASLVSFLGAKQDNMSIHPDSTAFAEFVGGTQLRIKSLTTNEVAVNDSCADLATCLALPGSSHNSGNSSWTISGKVLQEGDILILAVATSAQERSYVHNGGNAGDASDFTRLQTNYDESVIKAMFSGSTYIDYDANAGRYTLRLGLSASEVGAQTLPMDSTKFTTLSVAQDNQEKVNLALESLIVAVDQSASQGSTTLALRLDNLSGVSGSNLGVFSEGIFSENSDIKSVLQESESAHKSATDDRALIRSQFASADSSLQNAIDAEEQARIAAVSAEATSRSIADASLQAQIVSNDSDIASEIASRVAGDNALDARLDVIEGSGIGSIEKAQGDAEAFANAAVGAEAQSRAQADLLLQSQIDAIGDAVHYKGRIQADGRIQHKDSANANNNLLFVNASFEDGDLYRAVGDITLVFGDSTEIALTNGDSLVALAPRSAGTASAGYFHVWDNTESADILREGMLDETTIEKVAGIVRVKADSIDRSKLDDAVEADIDSKVEKAGDVMTGALEIDKVVTAGTGYAGGYDYSSYIKMKSVDTSSLTDTQRALLVENEIYTDGSGNPLDLDYANGATISSHYKGASTSMSVAVVGVNGEGRVFNPASAIYSTGIYGTATDPHLGVNTGGTFVAQNAATSNLGMFAFSDSQGALNNRGAYIALSDAATDLDAYRVARVASPLNVQDAALIIDDYTGVSHAMYVNGKSEFVGKVIVQGATADNEAVNLGDVKAKEYFESFNIGADSSVVINHGLGSKKLIVQIWLDDEDVTSSFDLEKSSDNSISIYNDTTQALSDVEVCIIKLSV